MPFSHLVYQAPHLRRDAGTSHPGSGTAQPPSLMKEIQQRQVVLPVRLEDCPLKDHAVILSWFVLNQLLKTALPDEVVKLKFLECQISSGEECQRCCRRQGRK